MAAAAGAGGLLGYGRWVEPRTLRLSRHAVRLSAAGAPASEATAEATPLNGRFRIVQLADLHLKGIGEVHEKLAALVDALAPDLLVFTGDTVDERDKVPLVGELLATLRTPAPKLVVLGNWEYQGGISAAALERELSAYGAELLVNRSVVTTVSGQALLVTGLDDWLRGRPDFRAALVGAPMDLRERGHHLVLAHCPAQRDELPSQPGVAGPPPPWILCGHTHGGQVGGPGLRITPRGSAAYVRGWYAGELPHLYVSRGIGTSVLPLRIGSPPEVASFDVRLG
jgi:predicted MPP superfamily phosphohydrolase